MKTQLLIPLVITYFCYFASAAVQPPAPLPPVPSSRQIKWHETERYAFVHFGINTFTGREWGDGKEDPKLFNPTELDALQWAKVFKDSGFGMVILTCKHHDGFCLWPSRMTTHSVASSPWKNGKGDVVKELSDACKEYGLKFGVYLSPWDRHEPSYGDSPRYNEFYKAQLRELLTNYGEISMVWFDGACGEGPNGRRQVYDWQAYRNIVRTLQPNAVMFSDAGPDVRWVGNESGLANETNWSMYNISKVTVGGGVLPEMGSGDINGTDWVPSECDVSIRPGWFYHQSEDAKIKPLSKLIEIYFKSVGRNSCLNLNVPPDKRGKISDADIQRLTEFKNALDAIFATNIATKAEASASNIRGNAKDYAPSNVCDNDRSTYWACDDGITNGWIILSFKQPEEFNVVMLQERIELGQRISGFVIEAFVNNNWQTIKSGTTIGYKRLLCFPTVKAEKIRLKITGSRACPVLSTFAVYNAPEHLLPIGK